MTPGGSLILPAVAMLVISSPSDAGDVRVTPQVRFSGGWTDNANGGAEETAVARPAVAAPFVLVEPGVGLQVRAGPRLSLRADYGADVERYRTATGENATAETLEGAVTVSAAGAAWTAGGYWKRKAFSPVNPQSDFRTTQGRAEAAVPLSKNRATCAVLRVNVMEWRWPHDRYPTEPGAAAAPRSDLGTRTGAGIRQRIGKGLVAGVQALWMRNASRALTAGPAGWRRGFSWTGPGAAVSAVASVSSRITLGFGLELEQRAYRDRLAGDPPVRVNGEATAVMATGAYAVTRVTSIVFDYAYLSLGSADQAIALHAHRFSLGVRLAPPVLL